MASANVMNGFVGFSNLPNQVHRRSVKEGFDFNIMIVGESGLAKKSVINTLFGLEIFAGLNESSLDIHDSDTVNIKSVSKELEEDGVKLRLTVVDTPGFGDFVNNEESWKPVMEEVENRLNSHMDDERRVRRRGMVDRRIHALLYFIPPGHGLRQIDVDFMKRAQEKVNLIPLIAKADMLTENECATLKARILADLAFHKITIFRMSPDQFETEELKTEVKALEAKIPFAVISSNEMIDVDGKRVLGRRYPWGFIEVDNEAHSDFTKVRHLLVRSHMEDLRAAADAKYEIYRQAKLEQIGDSGDDSPMQRFENEKKQFEAKMKKMESDMKAIFSKKVKEKEARLKHSKEKVHQDHQDQMAAADKRIEELEDKKRKYTEELSKQQAAAQKKKGFKF